MYSIKYSLVLFVVMLATLCIYAIGVPAGERRQSPILDQTSIDELSVDSSGLSAKLLPMDRFVEP